MNPKIVAEIKKDYLDNADFNPEIISKASKAAEGMCRWIFAMVRAIVCMNVHAVYLPYAYVDHLR